MATQGVMKKREIKAILRSFRDGSTITKACEAANISRNTLWLWCKRWPNLEKRIEEIKSSRVTHVVDAVYANAIAGKEASQKLFLSINGYKTGDGVNVSVPVTVAAKTEVNIPVASQEESERVKRYAELIRRHNLVSRVLGQDGHQPDVGSVLQGQQRAEDRSSGDTPGNSLAH